MDQELEEGSRLQLDFAKIEKVASAKQGVIPAVAQDIASGDVLIIGYVNRSALEAAQREKLAVFWSTSRNELWIKGSTSGDTLELVEIRVNCEQNAILYLVRPSGQGACHTKGADGQSRKTCFYRAIEGDKLRQVESQSPWNRDHG